jgi:RecB family exonuclease
VSAGAEDAAKFIAEWLPDAAGYAAGRRLVEHTDRLEDESLPFDGQVGREALELPEHLSPSALEEIGRCPLRALFARLMHARDPESPGADELEANEAGNYVHRALEYLYPKLLERGMLAPGTSNIRAIEEARRLLPAALDHAATEGRSRVRERHPTAWSAYRAMLQASLLDFVCRDLPDLLERGVAGLETEREIVGRVRVGAETLSISGKIDRIVRLTDGAIRVGDYKTSKAYDKPLSESGIKQGVALQIPLYASFVSQERETMNVTGEALTVPLRPERDRDDHRVEERSRPLSDLESLATQGLARVLGLLREGNFPLASDPDECRRCRYTVACRADHPASRARVDAGSEP